MGMYYSVRDPLLLQINAPEKLISLSREKEAEEQDSLYEYDLPNCPQNDYAADIFIHELVLIPTCSSCAKAKVKCDKLFPCARCTSKQIVCQSRSARSPSDNSARKSHRLLNPSNEAPGDFQRNTFSKPGDGEPSIPSRASGTDRQRQWATQSPPSSLARNRLAPTRALIGVDKSMQVLAQPDSRDSEARLHFDGVSQSSPDISFSPTPMLQDFRIEDFGQLNGSSWDQEDDRQFEIIRGIQTPIDLEMSNLTEFMSPTSLAPNVAGFCTNEIASGTNQNFSAAWNISPPTSVAYQSSDRSPSVVSSLDSRRTSHHVRSTSSHQSIVPEHQSVIAGQVQWQSFRCNPVINPNVCPKTARVHLEGLAQTLKNQKTWISWGARLHDADPLPDFPISTEPFEGSTRDKLLAITQSFLHKALETHPAVTDTPSRHASPTSHSAAFIILPPPNVLEYFLRAYVCCCEPYYPFVPAGILKTNELMQLTNGVISSLLLLLMIAQGAMATATVEARYLASGLTEACRISLFDTIEKDISLTSHPIVLRSALVLTNLAAWSGDKWHMDIALGQRGMYLAMLSNVGMLEFREMRLPPSESQANPGKAWETWKEHESRSRLVYSWVTVDQELSLFHDTAPIIPVTNLHATMPDSDLLWQSKSASEWLKVFQGTSEAAHKRPSSLCDIFRRFMEAEGEVAKDSSELSATQLRLLLHPLQGLVCHLRQLLSCFSSDGGSHRKTSRAVSRSATRARLDEVQSLLQQWYALSVRCIQSNTEFCAVSCANRIMYHLISLNTIICFAEIERLARRDRAQDVFREFHWLQICCIEQAEEIFFHCGQILRLIRSMPNAIRPPWWAAAVYRVALTSWVNCLASADARFRIDRSTYDKPFAIDALAPDHPAILRYLKFREGMPVLSKREGSAMSLAVPGDILTHCVEILQEESTTRFAAGIKNKLERMAERWKG